MEFNLSLFIVLLGFSTVNCFDVNAKCEYEVVNGKYQCHINSIEIDHNVAEQEIAIDGEHLQGKSNEDVVAFRLTYCYSQCTAIIKTVLKTFPNLIQALIDKNEGLKELRTNVYQDAKNLVELVIVENYNLIEIQAQAFNGASKLEKMNLTFNAFQKIDEAAFEGIPTVHSLNLAFNNLKSVPDNLYDPLPNIRETAICFNRLTSISQRLFAKNPNLSKLWLRQNQINAIDPAFFDHIPKLSFLMLSENVCINKTWWIDGKKVTLDTVRRDLAKCFENHADFEKLTNQAEHC